MEKLGKEPVCVCVCVGGGMERDAPSSPQAPQFLLAEHWDRLECRDVADLPRQRVVKRHNNTLASGSFARWITVNYDGSAVGHADPDARTITLSVGWRGRQRIVLGGFPASLTTRGALWRYFRGLDARDVLDALFADWQRRFWGCRQHPPLEGQPDRCHHCLTYHSRKHLLP